MGMVADVQQWLDQPAGNFGWLLRGDESASRTVKRFDSREFGGSLSPNLQVMFTPAIPTGACCGLGGDCQDTSLSDCQSSGGVFQSPGSSCALIQECPVFKNSFEN